MQPIKTLNDMIIFLQQRGDKKRVAVVCANDASTRYAVEKGVEMGFIEPIYVDGDDKEECARRAVALCKNGEADILMKGLVNTDVLLRAILDKEKGIIRPGHVLTHVAMAEIPKYENFPYTVDYLEIIAEAQTGKFGRCIIDGPLDLKTSLDSVSLREKGIHSVIDGQADALIFPDIVAGNVFYKTITLFGYAKTAGVLQGTQCCCVLPSRADSPESKYYSLALAAI